MGENLKRAGLSALIGAHLAAVLIWVLPECALRQRFAPAAAPYLLTTGQWQHWGMFAPNPARDAVAVEAQARDAHGLIHLYAFPRMAERPVLEAALGYRHSKFAHNLGEPTAVAYREYAARHAARAWNLPDDAFPLELDLYQKVWRSALLSEPEADPLAEPAIIMLQAYRFPNSADIRP